MIALDTNLLVYAHRRESPWHPGAKACVSELAVRGVPWAIPWPCLHEFLGIVTNPRIFKTPTPVAMALRQVEFWMESPRLVFLSEEPEYWEELRATLEGSQVVGPRVHDAHVAALCRHHAIEELWSADRDFGRFPGLLVRNPLVASP